MLSNQVRQDNLPLHQHISLQRKRSFRQEGNNHNEEHIQSEITKLQSQLDHLRGTRPMNRTVHNNHTLPISTTTTSAFNRSNIGGDSLQNSRLQTRNDSPKNLNIAQSSTMGTNHEDIREAFAFVSSAMETLKKFETKFATILNTNTTH